MSEKERRVMSLMGHKRTFCDAGAMSALPPKADIRRGQLDVRFVPKADMGLLLDHLIGNRGCRAA